MPPVYLPTAANTPGGINPSPYGLPCRGRACPARNHPIKPAYHTPPGRIYAAPTTQQQKALRPSGHSAFIITYSNQQIKNPPLPPQQHQLKILQTSKYIQNDRQNDPGLPLGWA